MKIAKINKLEERLGYKPYWHWVQDYWSVREKPLEFRKHKYLQQIYKDQSPEIVYEKSGQAGFTERMVTEAIWMVDQFKENSLYLFPTAGTIGDLVQERIDEPLNNNDYLRGRCGRVPGMSEKRSDKVGMKKIGKGFIYFRGSNKSTQITSVSADAVFVDELDRMEQSNIPYFDKRLIHSLRKWLRWASTPTIPNFGIDAKYHESDEHHCHVKCTHCNEWQILDFWKNIDEENELLVCRKCRKLLIPWECEMKWIADFPNRSLRGYHINQLYTPQLDIKKLIEDSKKTAEWEIMQFYNQRLGLPYEAKGAKIDETDIQACRRDYIMPNTSEESFMGVDVGKVLHIVISEKKRIIFIGEVNDFEELDMLMNRFNVKVVVIDALPETRKAQEFSARFRGRVYLCYYTGLKEVKEGIWYKTEPQKVNTDRTLSLDMSTNEIKTQDVEFPKNIDDYVEFKKQLKNLTRMVTQDSKGNVKAEYIQTGVDHYRHAFNYRTIAKYIFTNIPTFDVFGV